MKAIEIKKGIYWVGGIDWDLRNFHGYVTPQGSTYNAYLIIDEKVALVDTVKHYLFEEMMSRIRSVIDPAKIDYIISNHVEMDHSGCIPKVAEIAKKAVIITSPNGEKGLKKHYGDGLDLKVVDTGSSIKLGKRSISFVLMQMVHWPDSMASYVPEEKLLLPNDAFGQHIASAERYDDEIGWDIARSEAAKYYANIVLPYSRQVVQALTAVSALDIDMIAPSHGVIWRKYLKDIVENYKKWANNECDRKAVIVYDSMWGSTAKVAYAILDACETEGIKTSVINLKTTDISAAMAETLDARYIFVGSPTLNNGLMPTTAAFLTYMKGLAPRNRQGMAFGSYGWGGQSVDQVEEVMKALGFGIFEKIKVQYIPDASVLKDITAKVSVLLDKG